MMMTMMSTSRVRSIYGFVCLFVCLFVFQKWHGMAKSMEWRNFAWLDSCLYTPQRSPFAGPGYVEAPLIDTPREESIGGCLFVSFALLSMIWKRASMMERHVRVHDASMLERG
ncbi:hypothetical protein J3E69DRAFT_291027 [Trichoderma sp. SZMC 28015]